MQNKEIHQCSTCGVTWQHGVNANHSCSEWLKFRLEAINNELQKDNPNLRELSILSDVSRSFGKLY